jgi:hypothetical protein
MLNRRASTSGQTPPARSRHRAAFCAGHMEKISLLLVVVLILGGGTAASVYATRDAWQSWLRRFNPKTTHDDSSGSRVRRPDRTGDVAYLGNGRAGLGTFSIRVFSPLTRSTLRTDFDLEGETCCQNRKAFDKFMKGHSRFFREQVMITIRNSHMEDLVDPDLTLLRKKIIARVNRALGYRFLQSVEFDGFALYESVENSSYVPFEPSTDERAAPSSSGKD